MILELAVGAIGGLGGGLLALWAYDQWTREEE